MEQALLDDHFFSGDEIERKLQQAILKLPAKQRLVFNMRYYNELSYDEMSTILGTSAGALKASYHFAAKKVDQMPKAFGTTQLFAQDGDSINRILDPARR